MMQAKLTPPEFAYLLQTLEAQKVVGVNNAELFPTDPAVRDELLNRGLLQLQADGWFVSADGKISANSRLMVLVAVIANPEIVLTATHLAESNTRQIVTYYLAAEYVVEQFQTDDGDYVLTQLPAKAALVERLAGLFSLGEPPWTQLPALTFELATFETTLSQARSGSPEGLRQALQANDVPLEALDDLVNTIVGLKPAGKIEGAALAGQHLLDWQELALLADSSGRQWLARKDEGENVLELAPPALDRFKRLFRQFLQWPN